MINEAVFLGSKKLGFEIFQALVETDKTVKWTVLCPPDSNDSRTYFRQFSEFAKKKNIDLLSVTSPAMVHQYAQDHRPDVIVVCGYYRILPSEFLDLIEYGVWGIHNSLLPKYRGGSPLVWQMINDEPYLGSSFFRFSSGVDNGPILDQIKIPNEKGLTIEEASDRLGAVWITKIPALWQRLSADGDSGAKEQNHAAATYCAQRKEDDGEIDWNWDAARIDCFIRAQSQPYPRAFFFCGNQKLKIASHTIDDRIVFGVPGQVFEVEPDHVAICCGGKTVLRIQTLEISGKEAAASTVLSSIQIRL